MLKTPVLFIVFNRLEETKISFEAIRKVKPMKLYVSSDGPRKNKPGEDKKVDEIRKYIINHIDWPCKVKKLFRKENAGCKIGESSAITWLFENEERGIIIEDDNLASPSFFRFCEEMLEKYKDDSRVMQISGGNFLNGWKRDKYSYYFSQYPYIWGWASWRRAWKHYDLETKQYPELKEKGYFYDIYPHKLQAKILMKNLDATYYNNYDTWDYQWVYAMLTNNGLSIVPNKNLVQNIGMALGQGTHTNSRFDEELSIPAEDMEFPLKHPPFVIHDKKSDTKYFRWILMKKIRNTILRKTGLMRFFK